jgi:hypothetical protein
MNINITFSYVDKIAKKALENMFLSHTDSYVVLAGVVTSCVEGYCISRRNKLCWY